MGIGYGKKNLGFMTNGQAEYGDNTNFTIYDYYDSDSYSGNGCFRCDNTGTANSTEYIEVDTSQSYRLSVMVKGIANNYLGNPPSGYLGYTCYDSSFRYISLLHCGGLGNTTLSRDLTAGDTKFYITSDAGWYIGTNQAWNFMGIYPATHPEFSTAYEYTRLSGYRYDSTTNFTLTAQGDYEVNLDAAFPDIGYDTPAGTPVMNARYGSGHNYACSVNQIYSFDWTQYTSGIMTGEGRSGGATFRYATKYIRFLDLKNYRHRNETAGAAAQYLLDNIILVKINNQDPDQKLFATNRIMRRRNG